MPNSACAVSSRSPSLTAPHRDLVLLAGPSDGAAAIDRPAVKAPRAGRWKLFTIRGGIKELQNVCAHTTRGERVAASRSVAVAGLVVVGFLTMWPGLGPAQEAAPNRVDAVPAERALQALRRAWFDEIDELTAITRALAVADDTYEFVARPNLPYVYDHFGPKRLAADRVDTVLIINRKGKPLFWRRVSKGANRGFPDAEAFLAQLPALARSGATGARSLAGAARLAHGPSLVVALPIYPASGSGDARGWLITARALDGAERDVYEERAHVSVDVLDLAASALPVGAEAALKTPLEPVTRVEATRIRGFMSVADLNGRPFRLFSVMLPRPTARAASTAVSSVRYGLWLALAAVVAGIVCATAATSVLLRRRNRAAARAPVSAPSADAALPAPLGLPTAKAWAPAIAAPITVVASAEPANSEKSELEVTIDPRPIEPAAAPADVADAPAAAAALEPVGPPVAEARAPITARQVTVVAPMEPDNSQESQLEVTFDFRSSEPAAARGAIAAAPAAARDLLHARLTQTHAVIRYQPQINLRTGRVAGVEALLCIAESGADQPATELVAELEAVGLGLELAEWWIQEACSGRRYWRRQTGDEFPVSVPVSPLILEDPTFAALVRRILADNELSSQYLELEVPEAVLGGSAAARRTLADVHQGGVLVAIDRFDGSQSNLRSLTRVPIAKLRVHPDLVRRAGAGMPDVVLFDGIIGAARGLDIIVCATGVDSSDLAAAAERHQCSLAQGAYLGPLVDGEQFLVLVLRSDIDTATLRPLQLDQDAPHGEISSSWPRVAGGR